MIIDSGYNTYSYHNPNPYASQGGGGGFMPGETSSPSGGKVRDSTPFFTYMSSVTHTESSSVLVTIRPCVQ